MKLIQTIVLSPEQAAEIQTVYSLCRDAEPIILSCPDDGDELWLLYEDEDKRAAEAGKCALAAFFAVYKMDGDSWECYAFTRPDCRGQGYFSTLLDSVCDYSLACGEPDLCFVTDNRCPAALEVLEHLETEFMYDEYMMELELGAQGRENRGMMGQDDTSDVGRPDLPDMDDAPDMGSQKLRAPDCARVAENQGLLALEVSSDGEDGEVPGQITVTSFAGSCRLNMQGDRAYLFSLEIRPSLRRQGYGTRFLHSVITMLRERGCSRLCLQVSGANKAALWLYQKTGFRVTETLSYYLY